MGEFRLGNRILITNPGANIDKLYGPYHGMNSTVALQLAFDTVNSYGLLAKGLTVGITTTGSTSITEYWFKDAYALVSDLVPKGQDLTSINNQISGLTTNKLDVSGGTINGNLNVTGVSGVTATNLWGLNSGDEIWIGASGETPTGTEELWIDTTVSGATFNASQTSFTPYGTITSTNVQQAIQTLDDKESIKSYTLDFQTSATQLTEICMQPIQIVDIKFANVATLSLGMTPIPEGNQNITTTIYELLTWTITRTINGYASVGIKYIKLN